MEGGVLEERRLNEAELSGDFDGIEVEPLVVLVRGDQGRHSGTVVGWGSGLSVGGLLEVLGQGGVGLLDSCRERIEEEDERDIEDGPERKSWNSVWKSESESTVEEATPNQTLKKLMILGGVTSWELREGDGDL